MHRYAIFAVMLWGVSCAAPQKATTPETVVRMKPVKKSRCKNLKWTSLQPLLRAYSSSRPNTTEGEELRKDLVCYAKSFMEWMEIYDAAVNSKDQALKHRALVELSKTAKKYTDWEEFYPVSVKEKDSALQQKVIKNLIATALEYSGT